MLPIGAVANTAAADFTLRETTDAIATGVFKRLDLSEQLKDEYVEWFCKRGFPRVFQKTANGWEHFTAIINSV